MASIVEFSTSIRRKLTEIYDFTIGRFISGLFRKPSSLLFLGIDNAGKTTLVNKLKSNTNHVFLPTKHATKEVVNIGNLKAAVVDIGGHSAVRMAWKDYFYNVDGVVFVADTADTSRFNEVRESWAAVRELERDAPILVLMNKIDFYGENSKTILRNRALMDQLEQETGVTRSTGGQSIEIFYLSVIEESAYDEDSALRKSFSWLKGEIDLKAKK